MSFRPNDTSKCLNPHSAYAIAAIKVDFQNEFSKRLPLELDRIHMQYLNQYLTPPDQTHSHLHLYFFFHPHFPLPALALNRVYPPLSFVGGPIPFVHPLPDEQQISLLSEVAAPFSKARCTSLSLRTDVVFEHPTPLHFPSTSAAYLTAPLWTSLAVHENAVVILPHCEKPTLLLEAVTYIGDLLRGVFRCLVAT